MQHQGQYQPHLDPQYHHRRADCTPGHSELWKHKHSSEPRHAPNQSSAHQQALLQEDAQEEKQKNDGRGSQTTMKMSEYQPVAAGHQPSMNRGCLKNSQNTSPRKSNASSLKTAAQNIAKARLRTATLGSLTQRHYQQVPHSRYQGMEEQDRGAVNQHSEAERMEPPGYQRHEPHRHLRASPRCPNPPISPSRSQIDQHSAIWPEYLTRTALEVKQPSLSPSHGMPNLGPRCLAPHPRPATCTPKAPTHAS